MQPLQTEWWDFIQEVPVGVVVGGGYESAPYGLSRGRDQVHLAPGSSEQRLGCGQVISGGWDSRFPPPPLGLCMSPDVQYICFLFSFKLERKN